MEFSSPVSVGSTTLVSDSECCGLSAPAQLLFGSHILRDQDNSANFSGGIKGAPKVPSHYFQFLRRPGSTAKLLYFH